MCMPPIKCGLHVCRQTLKLKKKREMQVYHRGGEQFVKKDYYILPTDRVLVTRRQNTAHVALLSPCKDSTGSFSLGKDHVIIDEFNAKVW